MSKRIFAVLAGVMALSLPAAIPAQAELTAGTSSQMAEKPLMIIRFNQRNVYFERPLTIAIGKAEKAKPGIRYEVVSYVPGKGDTAAAQNLNAVVGTIQGLGVPKSRIQTSTESVAAEYNQEIHIFVY